MSEEFRMGRRRNYLHPSLLSKLCRLTSMKNNYARSYQTAVGEPAAITSCCPVLPSSLYVCTLEWIYVQYIAKQKENHLHIM